MQPQALLLWQGSDVPSVLPGRSVLRSCGMKRSLTRFGGRGNAGRELCSRGAWYRRRRHERRRCRHRRE